MVCGVPSRTYSTTTLSFPASTPKNALVATITSRLFLTLAASTLVTSTFPARALVIVKPAVGMAACFSSVRGSSAMAVNATRHITATVDRIFRAAPIIVTVCSSMLKGTHVGMPGFLGTFRGTKSLGLTFGLNY